jgi:chromosome segregation ATPase
VLYLAEVQKKTGFIGSGKPEFKLLACQRGENSWTAVPGDETVSAPDDATYGAGALVMVELTNNRQIQRHYEAGRSLVSILQTFSNLSKKSKTQEEEIEQWKQSLTFQSQELNRRELELEARQEQVEQAEADVEQLEGQRQELQSLKDTLQQQQEELERKSHDLEGAWEHLNGEKRRFEEMKSDATQPGGLDEAQVEHMQRALNRLTEAVLPMEALRAPLGDATQGLSQHQEMMAAYRQSLEEQGLALEQRQQELDQQAADLKQRWDDWHASQSNFVAKKEDLKLQQQWVKNQQDKIQALSDNLHAQTNLHQQLYELLNTSDKVRLSKKVDVQALEAMDLTELQNLVTDLEKDLEKVSRFVSDQEEELTLEQQALDEIKAKIDLANEFDRLELETELEEEQDRYQMLNETLVGQRRNLLEREEMLSQHRAVLNRRQGLAVDENQVNAVNLEPLLNSVDEQRQHTSNTLQAMEDEMKQAQEGIAQLKQELETMETDLANRRGEVEAFEAELQRQQIDLACLRGKLAVCQELLDPAQTGADGVRQSLDELSAATIKLQEVNDSQLQSITELRQTILSVAAPVHQMAAS